MMRWSLHLPLFSAVLYGSLSMVMTFLNKIVIARFFFDYAVVIMMLQMGLSLFILEVLRACKVVNVTPYTFERGRDTLFPSLLYCLHSYFALTALQGMNIPMYSCIKRCVPLVTLYLSVVVLKKSRPSRAVLMSVLMITGGAVIASATDLTFEPWSYAYGALSILCQSIYLILVEKLSLNSCYTPLDLVYLNSFNGLVYFLLADMMFDEVRDAFMYFITSSSALFWSAFGGLLITGVLLNFSIFLCTAYNSALATSIVGNVKAVVQTLIGYLLSVYILYDVVPHFGNVLGILINLAGGLLYAYATAKEKERGGHKGRLVDVNSNLKA